MRLHFFIISLFTVRVLLIGHAAIAGGIDSLPAKASLKFHNARQFIVIGQFHKENNYNRFPANYKAKLRPEVWDLSQDAAGISIRFRSNTTAMTIRWTLRNNVPFPHMAATGISGVDLYANVNGKWQFVQTGRPTSKSSEYLMFEDGTPIFREYLLNLPLYDGVDSLSIGINKEALISVPVNRYLISNRPVVYYGSSIAQGACASRPGMAFTNILERRMDRPFINMGFSGNGTFDSSVGEGMCETDAALFVIDCNPNTDASLVYERAVALVKQLKQCKPGIPVLIVENFLFEKNYFMQQAQEDEIKKQKELERAFKTLKKDGVGEIYYLKGDGLVGRDHEGTVDGVHPTDIGMMRMANALLPVIQKILSVKGTKK